MTTERQAVEMAQAEKILELKRQLAEERAKVALLVRAVEIQSGPRAVRRPCGCLESGSWLMCCTRVRDGGSLEG